MRSRTSPTGRPAPASTASAASRVHPPTKTDRQANASCSSGSSRSYDQSTAARNVWWRSTPRPPVSSRNRWLRRWSSSSTREHPHARGCQLDGEWDAVQPVAHPAIAARSSSPSASDASASVARRAKSSSDAASSSDGTVTSCSPGTRRPSLLVARIVTAGPARRQASVIRRASSSRCSQLSSTRSRRLERNVPSRTDSTLSPSRTSTASTAASTSTTRSSSTPANSTSHTPSG